MKVLFVFINNEYRPFVPVNLTMLEGYIKQRGHQTRVFDASFYADVINIPSESARTSAASYFGVDYSQYGIHIKPQPVVEDFIKMIKEWNPDLVAFSVYSYFEDIADRMAQASKARFPDLPIIYGGTHPTIKPEDTIRKEWIDWICVGEGEEALHELVTELESGGDTTRIRNIWARKDGQVFRNSLRPLIAPNDLPTPDWSSYASYQQYSPIDGVVRRLGMVENSRGCPYSCTYCESTTFKNMYRDSGFKKYSRYKSPEKMISDLEYIVNQYNLDFIYFTDGTFLVMHDPDFEKLAQMYSERIRLPFLCLTTVPSLSQKRAELLKLMGCWQVNMGIEAGDEQYRKEVLDRPNMTNEMIVNAFRMVRQQGIRVSGYSMIGLPWQSRSDIFGTIELNRVADPHRHTVSIFIPFAGTILRNRLVKEGIVTSDTLLGDDASCTVKVPGCGVDEILGLYRTFHLYCKAPKELFPLIKLCEADTDIAHAVRKILISIFVATDRGIGAGHRSEIAEESEQRSDIEASVRAHFPSNQDATLFAARPSQAGAGERLEVLGSHIPRSLHPLMDICGRDPSIREFCLATLESIYLPSPAPVTPGAQEGITSRLVSAVA